ncbi:hypothetical protein N7492_007284 [Penicillium capsulatum]|uniref:Cyanovirin-N domain-containing protein n=1 Tax=Penicillium capsulatum TaxID=69766 RepID=A0A9W9I2A7_9EURO|nr:hypothetical protein N7492_007284 [Penicillium capsulatum]KAJ6117124.1 hypothetical protein N7512_006849 [Penicillium capsulatum]
MGFHKTSMDIKLKNGHVLTAYCRRPSGDATYSELDLDEFLGAKKGKFAWSAENFSESASSVDLQLEGETHEPMLRAELKDGDGARHRDCVNLADCIKNENGHLRFMDCF